VVIGKRHALLWGPFFVFIVAFVLHVNQMYVMFAALSLLAPVSYLLGRRKLANIQVARHGKSIMTAGERGTVMMTVRNTGNLRQFFLAVKDRLSDGLESPEDASVMLPDLLPGGEQRLQYSLLARRRGVHQVGPPRLEGSDYLGLYLFTRQVGEPAELLVYPRAIPVPNLWPRSLHGRTPHKTSRRQIGPSPEYYGIRDYLPGDDPRRVDWKTTARRGKLMVVETEQSEAIECVVLLDLQGEAHAGHGDASTIEYAATLAASLSAEALSRGCDVGMIAHARDSYGVLMSSHPKQQILLLEALARVTADGEEGLHSVLAQHLKELTPGCTVAVISPSTDPEAVAVAARLRALGHPVAWFALAAHTFEPGPRTDGAGHGNTVARLAAQGARVTSIHGDAPLEASLWRGGSHGRRQ